MAFLTHAEYGKDKVRIFRIVRKPDGVQEVAEYIVRALLQGDIAEAWTKADNKSIIPTDTVKNTCNYIAKASKNVLKPEIFALEIAHHFLHTYAHLTHASVHITQLKWSRIAVEGKPHKYSFVRDGDEKRFTHVEVDASAGRDKIKATLKSGLSDLLVLKSSGSRFEGYHLCKWTTLKPVDDRIFSTAVDLSYTVNLPSAALSPYTLSDLTLDFDVIYAKAKTATLDIFATDDSASVQATMYLMCERILKENQSVQSVSYELPNKHYFPVDLSYLGMENIKPSEAEVFMPVDAPSGLIRGTVSRDPKARL